MPSKTIEEYLKTAKPSDKAAIQEATKNFQGNNLEHQPINNDPTPLNRQAQQVSSKEGKLSEPVQEHLASYDRAKQENAVEQALQSKQPDKTKQQDKSKEADLER